MPSSSAQRLVASSEPPQDIGGWQDALFAAFVNREQTCGFLPLAEDAVRAYPADGPVLLLAATAALLDEQPERALVFLKRFSKRYVVNASHHLLQALALGRLNKLSAARSLLERHRLTFAYDALPAFPGGWGRNKWLADRLDVIMGRRARAGRKRASLGSVKSSSQVAAKSRKAERSGGTPKPIVASHPQPEPLPRLDVDISFTVDLDLAALTTAAQQRPESDGRWYRLRERFAHLGLAQGFDELLCLPHLRGIDTYWHQVETVRKVLKQFRGRVLLADEVGLGKTIEAGMVLKEYLLRGMAENVLVLTPASLVGQWREELETKFDIPCVTTHDPLLREDPDLFWRQKRLIASLALARRREHAERLLDRSFDLVIVDEAHHLRDRNSQGYKLVDTLKKRFLLLLSATPVQNDLTELYNVLTLLKPGIVKRSRSSAPRAWSRASRASRRTPSDCAS
jgi:hypothetical protein